MRHPHAVSLLMTLLLCGCGASAPRDTLPAWVEQLPEQPGMLYAVGIGPDRASALESARFELAAQLRVRVQGAYERAQQERSTLRSDGSSTGSLSGSTYQHIIQRVASENLPDVRVAQSAERGQLTYILVAFDRAAWARSIRRAITEADLAIDDHASAHAAIADPLLRDLRTLHACRALLDERQSLIERLAIAAPLQYQIPAPIDVQALERSLETARSRFPLSLELDDAALRDRLRLALRTVGVRLSENAESTFTLQLNCDWRTSRHGAATKAHAHLRGTLRLRGSEDILLPIDERQQSGSLDADTARSRTRELLATALAEHWQEHAIPIYAAAVEAAAREKAD